MRISVRMRRSDTEPLGRWQAADHNTAMASGKKSALLSSLADYGDDSEPDSEADLEETGKLRANVSLTRLKNTDRRRDAGASISGNMEPLLFWEELNTRRFCWSTRYVAT